MRKILKVWKIRDFCGTHGRVIPHTKKDSIEFDEFHCADSTHSDSETIICSKGIGSFQASLVGILTMYGNVVEFEGEKKYLLCTDEELRALEEQIPEKDNNDLSETESLVLKAFEKFRIGHFDEDACELLLNGWISFKRNPSQLSHIQNYRKFGIGLLLLYYQNNVITEYTDIDAKQQLASVSYLFISKAINEANDIKEKEELYSNRVLLLVNTYDAICYTIASAVGKTGFDALFESWGVPRDPMLKMEFSDLKSINQIRDRALLIELAKLNNVLNRGSFGLNATEGSIKEEGEKYHKKVLEFLEKKVLEDCDVDTSRW